MRLRPAIKLLDILGISVIVTCASWVGVSNWDFTYDDAFITYRYAYNFAQGHGFVYNIGERFLGSSTPFYGLLLGSLGYLTSPDWIPSISGILSVLSLVAVCVFLYTYARLHDRRFCGFLAALLFSVSRMTIWTFGGELLFEAALILWAFYAYRIGYTITAAVLLVIAFLTRVDAALAIIVFGVHFVAVNKRIPWREIACVMMIVLPFLFLSYFYYGSIFPATLEAKLAQRDSGDWLPFHLGTKSYITTYYSILGPNPVLPAVPVVYRFMIAGLIGGSAFLLFFRFWWLPISWMILHFLTYSFLRAPFYHWYMLPVLIGFAICTACGIAGLAEAVSVLYRQLRRTTEKKNETLVFQLLLFLFLVPSLFGQGKETSRIIAQSPVRIIYEKVGQWLDSNTGKGASVGYLEIGFMGYYAHRKMVDPVGLVNPDVAAHVARHERIWAYEHYCPDYIIYNDFFSGWHKTLLNQPWFRSRYRRMHEFTEEGYPASLILFERRRP